MARTTGEPVWLPLELVLAMHDVLLDLYGGLVGVRDQGGLESALDRARNKWGYEEEADLSVLSAAYGYGLAKNHPFADGNKRTAFQSMFVFLGLNGLVLASSQEDAVLTMIGVAGGDISESALAAWIRASTGKK